MNVVHLARMTVVGVLLSVCLTTLADATPLQILKPDGAAVRQGDRPLRSVCPTQVEPLATALLRDLPAYMNRIYTRAVFPQTKEMRYAIVASQPDFTPLPLNVSAAVESRNDASVRQVFFTVLERGYAGRTSVQSQQYYWAFLVPVEGGWRLALIFSRDGSFPGRDSQPPTPPRENSQGVTALAIKTWLRDCEAGAVKL